MKKLSINTLVVSAIAAFVIDMALGQGLLKRHVAVDDVRATTVNLLCDYITHRRKLALRSKQHDFLSM